MKALTAMTAAELVGELAQATNISERLKAEYERTNWTFAPSDKARHEEYITAWEAEVNNFTAELERRCEDAGICVYTDGDIGLTESESIEHCKISKPNGDIPFATIIKNGAEFHALVGYLLAKGGGK